MGDKCRITHGTDAPTHRRREFADKSKAAPRFLLRNAVRHFGSTTVAASVVDMMMRKLSMDILRPRLRSLVPIQLKILKYL